MALASSASRNGFADLYCVQATRLEPSNERASAGHFLVVQNIGEARPASVSGAIMAWFTLPADR
jgi:hypothetical protein